MKKFVGVFTLIIMLLSTMNVYASNGEQSMSSYDRILMNGSSISKEAVEESTMTSPRILLGYKYVPGYDRLVNFEWDHTFERIYGTSIEFDSGTHTHQLGVAKSKTKSTEWDIQVTMQGEFDIADIKAGLQGKSGYKSTDTATVEATQTWTDVYDEPGLYELSWYMKGAKYIAQCGAEIQSTGDDHGNFAYCNMAFVTFPTNEVYFKSEKIR